MTNWFRSTPESEAMLAEERLVLAATEMVHEAMEKAGKNKQELAGMLGVRPSEISQRLSGRRNLTLRTLARMLHVLGMRAELSLKPALPSVPVREQQPFRPMFEAHNLKQLVVLMAPDAPIPQRDQSSKWLAYSFPKSEVALGAVDDDDRQATPCNA